MALFEQLLAAKWLIVAVFAALYVSNIGRRYVRLRHFDGPWSTGWCEARHTLAMLSFKSERWYKEVTDKYGKRNNTRYHHVQLLLNDLFVVHRALTIAGSIARIGPNDLLTSSPELLAHMSAVRSPYTRTAWFNRATRVEAGKDHIFSQIDEKKHAKRRQQMAAGVSFPFICCRLTLLTPTQK